MIQIFRLEMGWGGGKEGEHKPCFNVFLKKKLTLTLSRRSLKVCNYK